MKKIRIDGFVKSFLLCFGRFCRKQLEVRKANPEERQNQPDYRIKLLGSPIRTVSCLAAIFGMVLLASSPAMAAFGEDVEKPKPVFTRDGAVISAKLTPRGKSNSVTVRFEVNGGALTDVRAMDFASAKRPEIDQKDFRYDLFAIEIGNVPAGGEVNLSARSDFFSSSTSFFLFNANATPAWADSRAKHQPFPDRERELTMTVKDGGPFDTDGAADGNILLTGGPRDSFWGYAVGTLFIRFFGVFLVLIVLMIGMIVCGKFFEAADRRQAAALAASASKQAPVVQAPAAVVVEPELEPEMVAAIALALHMEMAGPPVERGLDEESSQSAWNLYGRQKIMSDRMQVQAFKRHTPREFLN